MIWIGERGVTGDVTKRMKLLVKNYEEEPWAVARGGFNIYVLDLLSSVAE